MHPNPMKSPLIQLRILLKPWWAKLAAVLIILMLITTWYATYIYLGWKAQNRVFNSETAMHTSLWYDFDLLKKINILPEWLIELAPELEQYGERVTTLSLTGDQLQIMSSLKHLPHIKSLHLHDNRPQVNQNLPDCLQYATHIKTFTLAIETFDTKLAVAMLSMSKLKSFTLNCDTLQPDTLTQLAKLPNLIELNITRGKYSYPLNTRTLEQLKHFKSLQQLAIATQSFNKEDAAKLQQLNGIQELILQINNPTNEGLKGLAQISNLKTLVIDESKYNNTPHINLSHMGKQPHLELLDVKYPNTTGFDKLFGNLPNLKTLHLQTAKHVHFLNDPNIENIKNLSLWIKAPDKKAPNYFKQLMNHNQIDHLTLIISGRQHGIDRESVEKYAQHLLSINSESQIRNHYSKEYLNFTMKPPERKY